MATCWKCGEPVPEGQVECNGCSDEGESIDPAQEIALGEMMQELNSAADPAGRLAIHLHNMGAEAAKIKTQIDDTWYMITIVRLPKE